MSLGLVGGVLFLGQLRLVRVSALFCVLALALASVVACSLAVPALALESRAPVADPDTSDSYVGSLLGALPDESADIGISTREAGRLWADKTVVANAGDGAKMDLDMATDGYVGEVSTDESFLTAFSLLGSAVNVYGEAQNPLDVVFLLDMSGSMGADVYASDPSHSATHANIAERISHSRIGVTVQALNDAIDQVMATNESSRVAVVGYGALGAEILPLAHYERVDGADYLKAENFTSYNSTAQKAKDWTGSSAYTVTATATRVDYGDDGTKSTSSWTKSVRNDYAHSGTVGNPTYIGYNTNMQVGIRVGFDECYNAYKDADDVTWSYHSKVYGRDVTLRRVPMAFVMTDGGANYSLKDPSAPRGGSGNEWMTQPITALRNSGDARKDAQKLYDAETDGVAAECIIVNNLLTASFMKSKVQNRYGALCQEAGALAVGEEADFVVHTVSVDTPTVAREVPRVYASLDPEHFFKPTDELSAYGGVDPGTWAQKADVGANWDVWQAWLAAPASSHVTASVYDLDYKNETTVKIATLPEGGWTDGSGTTVTKADIEENLLYADGFSDIQATDLASVFANEIARVGKLNTTPVSGANDLGIAGSLTYLDPLGKHMEVSGMEGLLLFGQMRELTCLGVHDHAFIDAWNAKGGAGFRQGWYSDADAGAAEWLGEDGHTWAEGAIYMLDCDHAKALIPNIAEAEGEKQQATRFVAWGVTGEGADTWRVNPAMVDWWSAGEYDPDTLVPYAQDGRGVGLYRLSDIRVWSEDTGDYADFGEAVVDDGYDRALYVNVPAAAIPLETVDVRLNTEEQVIYCETNVGDADATPLRVLYSVGLSEEVLGEAGEFDYRKADPDWLADNTDADGWTRFYSNWYSGDTWAGYGSGDPVSLGNAAITFSPSAADCYYVTQNALPLYRLVSYDGEMPSDADFWDGIPLGAIEDTAAWDSVATAGAVRSGYTIERVTDNSQMTSDGWYFMLVDYYSGKDTSKVDHVFRLVPRRGSEFGSIITGEAGDYLCWADSTCDHWSEWTAGSAAPHPGWTVAIRPGADRVGDLAQSKVAKAANGTSTSENRIVPTISKNSTADDFIVNAYLGNDGVLEVRQSAYFTPAVKKVVLDGDGQPIGDWDFTAKPFEFEIASAEGAPLPAETRVAVGSDGLARWGEIPLPRDGTYRYEVSEVRGDLADVTYDDAIHSLDVSVTSDGSVVIEWDGEAAGPTIENVYAPDVRLAFALEKEYREGGPDGEELGVTEGQFAFTLSADPSNPEAPLPAEPTVRTGPVRGLVTWGEMTYTEPGEFDYLVSEVDPGDPDVVWDRSAHKVHVSVTREADHGLRAEWTWDGRSHVRPVVVNYHQNAVSLPVMGGGGWPWALAVGLVCLGVAWAIFRPRPPARRPAHMRYGTAFQARSSVRRPAHMRRG